MDVEKRQLSIDDAVSSADKGNDVNSDAVVSKERFNSVVQGQGKKIKELESQLSIFLQKEEERKLADEEKSRKEMESKGEYEKILAKYEAEKNDIMSRLTTLQEKEVKRLEAVTASNEERLKQLPKDLQILVPPGLDPDGVSAQLNNLERIASQKVINVHGGGGKDELPSNPEDRFKALSQKGADWLFSKNKKK